MTGRKARSSCDLDKEMAGGGGRDRAYRTPGGFPSGSNKWSGL